MEVKQRIKEIIKGQIFKGQGLNVFILENKIYLSNSKSCRADGLVKSQTILSEAYSESSQTFQMERFAKIVFWPSTAVMINFKFNYFNKKPHLRFLQGPECTSD